MVFHSLKAKQEIRQKQKKKYQKQSQHKNRKAETYTMKTEQNNRRNN